MQQNLEAVLQVMRFIYDNIIYAELNTKSDYCQVCGWDGEIEIVEQDGKLIWRCPQVRQHRPGQDECGPPHLRDISGRSSGTRAARRRLRSGSCICKP